MNLLRTFGALAALAVSAVLAAHLVKVFRPVILPTLRQLGREQTTFLARRVDGQAISGWRILLAEFCTAILCLLTLAVGVYALIAK